MMQSVPCVDARATIAIIGAGNVASHIAPALALNNQITQIYSPSGKSAERLASRLNGCEPARSLDEIRPVDIIIIMAKDDAIADIAKRLAEALPEGSDTLMVHTSGSVGIEAISETWPRAGVLYPLQTFTSAAEIDLTEVPFFIETASAEDFKLLSDITRPISTKIYKADSNRRRTLHIAAVFACNFVNHMYAQAADILEADCLDLSVLYPLMKATTAKAMKMHPAKAQTGPAARGDLAIMNKHIEALPTDKAKLYRTISEAIISRK